MRSFAREVVVDNGTPFTKIISIWPIVVIIIINNNNNDVSHTAAAATSPIRITLPTTATPLSCYCWVDGSLAVLTGEARASSTAASVFFDAVLVSYCHRWSCLDEHTYNHVGDR